MAVIILGKLEEKPTLKLLSRIKCYFAVHWRNIACELLTGTSSYDIEVIEHKNKADDEKCFDMLKRWVEVDVTASYSKLINALHVYSLVNAAEKIKDEVEKTVLTYG